MAGAARRMVVASARTHCENGGCRDSCMVEKCSRCYPCALVVTHNAFVVTRWWGPWGGVWGGPNAGRLPPCASTLWVHLHVGFVEVASGHKSFSSVRRARSRRMSLPCPCRIGTSTPKKPITLEGSRIMGGLGESLKMSCCVSLKSLECVRAGGGVRTQAISGFGIVRHRAKTLNQYPSFVVLPSGP